MKRSVANGTRNSSNITIAVNSHLRPNYTVDMRYGCNEAINGNTATNDSSSITMNYLYYENELLHKERLRKS
jgi:hypothetical protein